MSFARLIDRFRNGLQTDAAAEKPHRHDPLKLATAAVLLDIAYADGEFTPPEQGDLAGFLTRAFALSGELAEELIKAAEEIRSRTIDHFALTSYIRRHASLEERIDIVKTMWRMVYSDGRLTDYENYLVRKLADLLGLEHHVMIQAKVAVLEERGTAAS
ncbi:MAG TPA: TerB family tellurite resistance protein [Thermoanaerobaculia bacterium]|nr:TerB family tellurite resistance protein [Thermoanaerobaculia bacterium]